jgi:hypothetical protein
LGIANVLAINAPHTKNLKRRLKYGKRGRKKLKRRGKSP